jgi:hypothetical protein
VSWLNLIRIGDFVEAGLHEALTSVIDRIHEIGGSIHRTYFDQQSSLNPDDWPQLSAKPKSCGSGGPTAPCRAAQTTA